MAKAIVKTQVKLPDDCEAGKFAIGLYNVFTKKECEELIRVSEEMGFEAAQVTIGAGRQKLMPHIRDSSRCLWDSAEQADVIWQRIKPYVPETWDGHRVVGLDGRLRILRYDPGQYFVPHMDGCSTRDNGETSFITSHLYLNEGYKGGSTTFVHSNNAKDRMDGPKKGDVEFKHKTGSVLLFEHRLLHEGSPLFKGRKYTIRTDVFYEAKPEQSDDSTAAAATAAATATAEARLDNDTHSAEARP